MNREEPPAAGVMRPFVFPDVGTANLGNGIPVHTVTNVSFPLVTAMVLLQGGETAAPEGVGGLAVLAGRSLEGGTGSRSGRELARALETIGATFGAATGWDATTVAVTCRAEHLPAAMTLLADMVREPGFSPDEFGRFKAQQLSVARQRLMDPAALAKDGHARLMYRDADTYARPLGGTEASLDGVSADDARAFAQGRYGPGVASVIIAGDVEPTEARDVADQAFGDWSAATAPLSAARAAPRHRTRVVRLLHRPGSVQSEIVVGHAGAPRSAEDYLALRVMNMVLGGFFSSRLNLNLRERNGFTYGVRSGFAARKGPGPFAVATAVDNKVTGAALAEILREVETMAESGPDQNEVQSATRYLAGVFPLRLETTAQLAARVATAVLHNLPDDYYSRYRSRVRAVTREQAAAAARRHLRPDELCTVVVGDADQIADQLDEAGAGPVSVRKPPGPGAEARASE